MMRVTGVLLAVVTLVGCKHTTMATPDQCQQLLEHFWDLNVADDPHSATMTPAERAELRERVKVSLRHDGDVEQVKYDCITEVTGAEYACAISATTANHWNDCIE